MLLLWKHIEGAHRHKCLQASCELHIWLRAAAEEREVALCATKPKTILSLDHHRNTNLGDRWLPCINRLHGDTIKPLPHVCRVC